EAIQIDVAQVVFRKPQIAVRTGRDAEQASVGRNTGAEFGDDTLWRNATDTVDGCCGGVRFGEPDVAVGTGRDAAGNGARRQPSRKFGHDTRGRYASNSNDTKI